MIKKLRVLEDNFNINKAAAIIAALTFASAFAGFIRDRLFASKFGAGDLLDVYYAAFHIPDFIYNLLVLGTLSVAFIPIFTEWLIKDRRQAFRIANTILNVSTVVMALTCLLLFFLSVPLTRLLVPGFSDEKFRQTLMLTRMFLLSPLIFTVSSVFGSILNSQKRFLVANLAPVLYNLGIIFGLLYFYPLFGLLGLAYGVIFGALLHLSVQVAEAVRLGFTWQWAWDLHNEAVRRFGKLFLPRIFGLDMSQISLLIGSVIGSFLTAGTIAVLNLANNLRAVPVNTFAVSFAVAAFPVLSEQFAKRDLRAFVKTLGETINQVLFFMIPMTIFILLFRAYIVRLAYGAGKFNWADTTATFNTLGIFALSLFAQALLPVLARAFYARHNTKTPVITSLSCLVLNIILAYWFGLHSYTMQISFGRFGYQVATGGAAGIALGFTIANIVNCVVLFFLLRSALARELPVGDASLPEMDGSIALASGKIMAASLAMGLAGYAAIFIFAPLVNTRTAFGILVQAGLAALVSATVFLLCARLLKLPQAGSFGAFFKKRLTRS
ncbi:MAG TPA: murein biosynthesis integral membrane protein MurJ [Patescibacteria group bacterium]|nr:murein biosynthesis integral membrane protein MurJ [Patescibacteria group bacterium]